jgi:hypothetical protein
MYKLTKIGAEGQELSDDATGHEVVRVERDLLAHPLFIANVSPPEPVTWKQANAWAEALTINGWAWRLTTVEEAFLTCNHNRKGGVLDPVYFDKVQIRWAWTSTEDPDTSGCARGVGLRFGSSGWSGQDFRDRALAVRAGQSI